MTHADEGRLQTYLDGELAAAERSTLEVHLAACHACRESLDELRRIAVDVHMALAEVDMAAGIASAFREFTARREALGGAPVAAIGAAKLHAARRWTAFGRPLRTARSSLLKAAALALLLAGAAGAAIPGSPLRQWIESRLNPVDTDIENAPVAEPRQDISSTPAIAPPPAAATRSGFGIIPVEGSVSVRLHGVDQTARIRVVWTNARQAEVRLADPATGRHVSSQGRFEAYDVGAGNIVIELPRSLASAAIEIDGQLYLRKAGNELETPGPVVERTSEQIVFEAR